MENKNLNKEDIISFLKKNKEYLNKEFSVVKIALFGSYARDEANKESGTMTKNSTSSLIVYHYFLRAESLLDNKKLF